MSNIVSCPFCENDIEDDSFYCDQCGEKLKICTKGHGFRKGKICTQCGSHLIEAITASSEQNQKPEQPLEKKSETNLENTTTTTVESTIRNIPPKAKPQFLVGKSINAKLILKDGAVIGRRTGEYIDTFSSQGYVSGTHAKIQLNNNGCWEIIDLDSTNGTFVNGNQIKPQQSVMINMGDEIAFYSTKFIVE